MTARNALAERSMAMPRAAPWWASACGDSRSLSKIRARKWRIRIRLRMQPDGVGDRRRRVLRIRMADELGEHLLERGVRAQRPQGRDRVVGHHPAAVQHDHALA